jgi:hypothetical protein
LSDIADLRFKRSQLRAKIDGLAKLREQFARDLDEAITELDNLNLQLAGCEVERVTRKVELPPRRVPLEMAIQ